MLLEHKLFDYTVLQYQTILETVDKILNFTQSSFSAFVKAFFPAQSTIKFDPYVQVKGQIGEPHQSFVLVIQI